MSDWDRNWKEHNKDLKLPYLFSIYLYFLFTSMGYLPKWEKNLKLLLERQNEWKQGSSVF